MSDDFDVIDPERFTTGAVGKPGERVFYLQSVSNGELVSLKCEKVQVATLGEYLNNLLTELPAADWETVGDVELVEPVLPNWTAGQIAVAYDEANDRVVIVVEELVAEGDEGATARFVVTRDQVRALVRRTRALLVASRASTNGHGH